MIVSRERRIKHQSVHASDRDLNLILSDRFTQITSTTVQVHCAQARTSMSTTRRET
jgi:hypothetical protein